jgi:hypothetical protein
MVNSQPQQASSELRIDALAKLAMGGGAFDDLADETVLDSFSDGDEIGSG